jgi:V8-like Glu-specific endopeptidase
MVNISFAGPVVLAIGRQTADGVSLLGTGFGITSNKIATAAHVVGHDDSNLVAILPQNTDPNAYQDTTNNTASIASLSLASFDPVKDLAVLDLPGLTLSNAPIMVSTDSAPPGTPIVTWGYPHADTGRLVLTQHSALVGARVFLGSSNSKVKHIVLNIQTRPGQSGSPVMLGNNVVAVVTGAYRPAGESRVIVSGIDPTTLHQTTHAVSAEYLRGML